MSRLSRGCLPCRTRRVKCDEGRPACKRCTLRGDVCSGYRDESSLIFRNENEKASRKHVRRRASAGNLTRSAASGQSSAKSGILLGDLVRDDLSICGTLEFTNSKSPYPWVKNVPQGSAPSAEDHAVSQFFEKYVMYPCNHGSSPGFLEQLPGLFGEVNSGGRLALRWAVRAAAYASLSNERDDPTLGNSAIKCYGQALSALAESLADTKAVPDDHILMTVVVLDLFEAIYLPDAVSKGSHAEGMAQILRLRGPEQIYGARGWSLFRLSHHRLQKEELTFRQEKQRDLAVSDEWLDSLNEELPYVRIEKDNFQINKTCSRARSLLKSLDNFEGDVHQLLSMIKEMHELDRIATTWRKGPEWAYREKYYSNMDQDWSKLPGFPAYVQLHHDVWIAYEWNYHRTGRIVMHEHLVACLGRLQNSQSGINSFELASTEQASLDIIWSLTNDILSTVPQSLGDIDHQGNFTESSSGTPRARGVGAYFLLWPIKMIKGLKHPSAEQKLIAQAVFERIREYTGMKSTLGERSNI